MLARHPSEPMAVGSLVTTLGLAQPAVSKHLAVLREVGIVAVTRRGRQRMYQFQPDRLRDVHEWIATFERHWTHHADRIKARAEQRALDQPPSTPAASSPEAPRTE